jgi:hypothetical protein
MTSLTSGYPSAIHSAGACRSIVNLRFPLGTLQLQHNVIPAYHLFLSIGVAPRSQNCGSPWRGLLAPHMAQAAGVRRRERRHYYVPGLERRECAFMPTAAACSSST